MAPRKNYPEDERTNRTDDQNVCSTEVLRVLCHGNEMDRKRVTPWKDSQREKPWCL